MGQNFGSLSMSCSVGSVVWDKLSNFACLTPYSVVGCTNLKSILGKKYIKDKNKIEEKTQLSVI